jgi:hypothetical protein
LLRDPPWPQGWSSSGASPVKCLGLIYKSTSKLLIFSFKFDLFSIL